MLTNQVMAFDETSKLPFWLEIIVFFKNQDVLHFLLQVVFAAIKGVADVMGNSVRRFEQQENFIGIGAFEAVAGCDPCSVLHLHQDCLRFFRL